MMNKLVRILMSKSIKRISNPRDNPGVVYSYKILRVIKKNILCKKQ